MANVILFIIFVLFGSVADTLAWNNSYDDSDDQNVLTIFLPILAVAIALCAGGCCYMERKRKKKLEKAQEAQHYPQTDQNSDAESITSTTSSRRRSYMLPSSTGRDFRPPSRAGSTHSAYDPVTSYGEPPPYSGRISRRSSIASTKPLDRNQFNLRGVRNDAYDASSIRSDSKSTQDEFSLSPMRRTKSSNGLYRSRSCYDNRYGDYSQNDRDFNGCLHSRGTDYEAVGSFSVSSLPMRSRVGKMKRYHSQPNLSRTLSKTIRTYPRGILKGRVALSEDGKSESDSGRGSRLSNQVGENRRTSARTQNRCGVTDSQYGDYSRRYPTFSDFDQSGYGIPSHSSYSGDRHPVHYSGSQSNWMHQNYHQNYDHYGYGVSGYDDPQNRTQSHETSSGYGRALY